jgi:hypothetical protein
VPPHDSVEDVGQDSQHRQPAVDNSFVKWGRFSFRGLAPTDVLPTYFSVGQTLSVVLIRTSTSASKF